MFLWSKGEVSIFHSWENQINNNTNICVGITGSEDSLSIQNHQKDIMLKWLKMVSNMISRLCIAKIIMIDQKPKENTSIGQLNIRHKDSNGHLFIGAQSNWWVKPAKVWMSQEAWVLNQRPNQHSSHLSTIWWVSIQRELILYPLLMEWTMNNYIIKYWENPDKWLLKRLNCL